MNPQSDHTPPLDRLPLPETDIESGRKRLAFDLLFIGISLSLAAVGVLLGYGKPWELLVLPLIMDPNGSFVRRNTPNLWVSFYRHVPEWVSWDGFYRLVSEIARRFERHRRVHTAGIMLVILTTAADAVMTVTVIRSDPRIREMNPIPAAIFDAIGVVPGILLAGSVGVVTVIAAAFAVEPVIKRIEGTRLDRFMARFSGDVELERAVVYARVGVYVSAAAMSVIAVVWNLSLINGGLPV